jgi:hypothetical protein
MQQFLNPLTISSGEIYCHGHDPPAQWSYAWGFFIIPVVLDSGPLSWAIRNKTLKSSLKGLLIRMCIYEGIPPGMTTRSQVFIAGIIGLASIVK